MHFKPRLLLAVVRSTLALTSRSQAIADADPQRPYPCVAYLYQCRSPDLLFTLSRVHVHPCIHRSRASGVQYDTLVEAGPNVPSSQRSALISPALFGNVVRRTQSRASGVARRRGDR